MADDGKAHVLPGTTPPRRFRPKFHYELLVCGLRGHELIGTDAAELRPEDALVAREMDGVRWYRCLRCDSWLPLGAPSAGIEGRRFPPQREEIELPLRGRPLRDKVVLRVIAVDRALHFVVLGLLGLAILLFASRNGVRHTFYRVLSDLQEGVGGGPVQASGHGFLHEVTKLFTLESGKVTLLGVAVLGYAALEGVEAIGLWFQKRWAEYLTFVATSIFLPLEVYELSKRFTPFKVSAFVLNLAVVIYLLLAKRLFGLRGGAAAEEAVRERDMGWDSLERAAPERVSAPSPSPSGASGGD
ncbi:MAG: hypothetical protein QOK31_2010 [Solirubrobacteraceae bacterium]|jgi:uncharacterized membrane protein (DUF2068 family)|nr:hypothetical protein [Solirubrobacteraceae bacterium]